MGPTTLWKANFRVIHWLDVFLRRSLLKWVKSAHRLISNLAQDNSSAVHIQNEIENKLMILVHIFGCRQTTANHMRVALTNQKRKSSENSRKFGTIAEKLCGDEWRFITTQHRLRKEILPTFNPEITWTDLIFIYIRFELLYFLILKITWLQITVVLRY